MVFKIAGLLLATVLVCQFTSPRQAKGGPGDEKHVSVSSFKVTFDGMNWLEFDSVSGLRIDFEDLAYHCEKNETQNRPGKVKANDICLKRKFGKDKELYEWMRDIKNGTPTRKDGSVILLDDEGKVVGMFNFYGAWPKSWSIPILRAGEEVTEEFVISVSKVEIAK